MKSIQDLCMYQKVLSAEVHSMMKQSMLSIEIFDDKSFRILIHKDGQEASDCIYDSDNYGDYDINDLPYIPVELLAKEILEAYSVKNVTVEEL